VVASLPDSTEGVWLGIVLLRAIARMGVDPIVVRTLGALAVEAIWADDCVDSAVV
jgi:hypothetical protein